MTYLQRVIQTNIRDTYVCVCLYNKYERLVGGIILHLWWILNAIIMKLERFLMENLYSNNGTKYKYGEISSLCKMDKMNV